jgi:phytoene dehydrogenase-like protein
VAADEDAIHNGLVAAAMLADGGWEVLVLKAQAEPGGAVKSAELFPGYVSDLYSAFYPRSVASPVFGALGLEDDGLRWTHTPAVVGHARSAGDEDAPLIYRVLERTVTELERRDCGDGHRRWPQHTLSANTSLAQSFCRLPTP